jgi:hypothetical protein
MENAIVDTAASFTEKLFPIGKCRCGGDISSYVASELENVFNAYCLNCGSVSDIRFPKSGDRYYWSPGQTMKAIQDARVECGLVTPDLESHPVSQNVNEKHGSYKQEVPT